jgi:hypothetical protein
MTLKNDENGSEDDDDPFGDFIDHELDLDDDVSPFRRAERPLTEAEYEALRRQYAEQLRAEIRRLAEPYQVDAWVEELDADQEDILEAMTEQLPQLLEKRYAGRLTEDQWRDLVRSVTALAYHADALPSPLAPRSRAFQRFVVRSQARLFKPPTVMPPQAKWKQHLPDLLLLVALGAILLLFVLNGGQTGFSRTFDELQATMTAQTQAVVELRATVTSPRGLERFLREAWADRLGRSPASAGTGLETHEVLEEMIDLVP